MEAVRASLLGLCGALFLVCGCSDSGLKMTLEPSSLSVHQFQGHSTALRVQATVEGTVEGPVQVLVVDSADVLDPALNLTQVGGGLTYLASFRTQPGLSVGPHQGTLQIRVCGDAACGKQYAQTSLPYDITVLNEEETHLTALSPWSGVGDWTTLKGGAAHNAYVPVELNPARFSQRWLWRDPNHDQAPGSYTHLSNPISVAADGTAYLTSERLDGNRSVLFALKESDGSEFWEANLGALYTSAPAVAGGQVYLLTGGGRANAAGSLQKFQARTGSIALQAPLTLTDNGDRTSQPLIVGQKVYASFTTQTQALDASSGALLWSVESGADALAPAVDGERLYYYPPHDSGYNPEYSKNFAFTALDAASGRTVFTVAIPPALSTEGNVRTPESPPVLAGNGRVLVNRNAAFSSAIDCVDVQRQAFAWSVPGDFSGMPAVAGDVFYILNRSLSRLEARGVADGNLRWSWSPSSGVEEAFESFEGDLVVTKNLVFVSTDQQVYAVDIEKRSAVWAYPAPGSLSVSASGILYIVGFNQGKVAAINLQ